MKALPPNEIIFSKAQFLKIWNYSRVFRGERYLKTCGLHKHHLAQMPNHFFNSKQDPIYCESLLYWLDNNGEPLCLERNPVYLAIIANKNPEAYQDMLAASEKEFYDVYDIKRIFGFSEVINAETFIRKHDYGLSILYRKADKWIIPKKIIDSELKLERVERGCSELERKIIAAVKIHAVKMKKIDEIDAKKTLALFGDAERYTLDVKLCQDDCLKGKAGACQFYDIRDNEGLRSSCIYVRAHISNIVDKVGKFIKPKEGVEENYDDAIRSQQFRAILNLEARHKYMSLQQPHTSTVWEKKTKHGEEQIICSIEQALLVQDGNLLKLWRELGIKDPPKSKVKDITDAFK